MAVIKITAIIYKKIKKKFNKFSAFSVGSSAKNYVQGIYTPKKIKNKKAKNKKRAQLFFVTKKHCTCFFLSEIKRANRNARVNCAFAQHYARIAIAICTKNIK